jgi:hypothetical protein
MFARVLDLENFWHPEGDPASHLDAPQFTGSGCQGLVNSAAMAYTPPIVNPVLTFHHLGNFFGASQFTAVDAREI